MMNEEVLGRVGERRLLGVIKGRKKNWLGHCMRQTQDNIMVETLEDLVNGNRNKGREKDKTIDDIITTVSRKQSTEDVYKRQDYLVLRFRNGC